MTIIPRCIADGDPEMEVSFATTRLERLFASDSSLAREYGIRRARFIRAIMTVLVERPTLAQVPATPPLRCHQLIGDRDEQFAVNVDRRYRLVFEPARRPIPRRADNGIDIARVTAIVIIEVVDYH